ncbi:MAG: hypothetical protein AAB946_02040 [Patescibacteria group bacterium]
MKKYDIKANFITTVEFPVIKAKNKREAIEKAELLLLQDKHLTEEPNNYPPTWEVDRLVDD